MSRNAKFDKEIRLLKGKLKEDYNTLPFPKTPDYDIEERGIYLIEEMLRTYEAKDTDYSHNGLPMGNLRSSEEVGVPAWKGTLIRLRDKKNRIVSFADRNEYKVEDEKIADTLLDLSNYSLLCSILFREKHNSEEIVTNFRNLAFYSLACRLIYEYYNTSPNKDNFKPDKWKEECYHKMLENSEAIAKFAREN